MKSVWKKFTSKWDQTVHPAGRAVITQAHAVSTQLLETAATQTKTPNNVSACSYGHGNHGTSFQARHAENT